MWKISLHFVYSYHKFSFMFTAIALCFIFTNTTSCKKNLGCTDINAANYDETAQKNDGSCLINSTYPSLNGKYTYHYYWSDNDGIEEIYRHKSYTFDGTRKAEHYVCLWSYTFADGWRNPSKEGSFNYYEWKVENNLFLDRLWQNFSSGFYPYSFQYIDENSFILSYTDAYGKHWDETFTK